MIAADTITDEQKCPECGAVNCPSDLGYRDVMRVTSDEDITAVDITDDQIREWESDVLATGSDKEKCKAVDLATRALAAPPTLVQSAKMTRGEIEALVKRRRVARARCAEILSARKESK